MFAENDLIAQLLSELGLSTANRALRLRLACADGIRDDLLMPQRIVGSEAMCEGIEYRVLCISADDGIPLKSLIGLAAEVQIVTDRGQLHSICGIVTEVSAGQCDGGLATYQLVLRDMLGLMDLDTNMRVFLDKNELDIIEIILGEWRRRDPVLASSFEYKFSIELRQHNHPRREFTMQYNETDAAFIRRLMKRRGIAWYFRSGRPPVDPHEDDGKQYAPLHTLMMFDSPALLKKNSAGAVRFHRADSTEQRDTITAWGATRTLRPGSVTGFSWDATDPLATNFMTAQVTTQANQGVRGNRIASGLDDYRIETPNAGTGSRDHVQMEWARMARYDYETKHFHGESTVRDLKVGEWNRVDGHAEIDSHPAAEREFVITSLQVVARNNLSKEGDARIDRLFSANRWSIGDGQKSAYQNTFTCVRRGVRIVPSFHPRNDVPNAQMHNALVVGPPGEEVHCDRYGRVKVRFPGTRAADHEHAHGAGAMDTDVDSAYVRVGTSWAGNGPGGQRQFGTHTLPRVGSNVLIGYENGDPDRPVILDQLFNHHAPPPTMSSRGELPGNRFQSGIRSREVGHGRGNQLRFDDTPKQISAQLASEHGFSELNLGWVTEPRVNGMGERRGEGAELRSDQAVSIRGGQGVLISAKAQLKAAGLQLERDGLKNLTGDLVRMQKQLAELAVSHDLDAADGNPAAQLLESLNQWDRAGNTDIRKAQQPIVGIDAPAGFLVGSDANVCIGANTTVDVVSNGNTQISTGRRLLMHARESINLFARTLGMKLIAASGKVAIQAQTDEMELVAKNVLRLLSESDWIDIRGRKGIRLHGAGSTLEISNRVQFFTASPTLFHGNLETLPPKNGSNPTSSALAESVLEDQAPQANDLLRFKIQTHHSQAGQPLANLPYAVFKGAELIDESITDDTGELQIKHAEGTPEYRVVLGNGEEFILRVVPDLTKSDDSHSDRNLANQGLRALDGTANGRIHV